MITIRFARETQPLRLKIRRGERPGTYEYRMDELRARFDFSRYGGFRTGIDILDRRDDTPYRFSAFQRFLNAPDWFELTPAEYDYWLAWIDWLWSRDYGLVAYVYGEPGLYADYERAVLPRRRQLSGCRPVVMPREL